MATINPLDIIEQYYHDNPELKRTLVTHSQLVAEMAVEVIERCGYDADLDFVKEAAMLHDIGVFRCNAPDIYCYGTQPYICHGIEGSALLQSLGLPRHALVCERHTGSGLTIEDIQAQNLPLPLRPMLPVTLEEKAICYADKFYSKSGSIETRKPLEKVIASMARHGADTLNRFMELHTLFQP